MGGGGYLPLLTVTLQILMGKRLLCSCNLSTAYPLTGRCPCIQLYSQLSIGTLFSFNQTELGWNCLPAKILRT